MGEPEIDNLLDAALGAVVHQSWDEQPAQAVVSQALAPDDPAEPEYPPVPVRHEPTPAPSPLTNTQEDDEGEPSERGLLDIGLLADLASGRKTADQAARYAGVSVDEIQAAFAVTLRQVPPEEIAKAMGLQAAEQQLKSGAIYGAVLADLVSDMASGRLKPETKIELAKLLARVGRIEPKEDKNASAGSGFVLNINLGGAETKPVIIDAG